MNFRNKKYLPDSIEIKIKASHINFINKNAVRYTIDAVKSGISSWIKPYQKPQLIGHDKQSDPVGRITSHQLIHTDSLSEPQDYVQLTAKITDGAAIEKIMDGRYNTVSVGSKSSKVICSECDQNIIEDGLCEHKKGGVNPKGKRIHWIIDQIDYVECSFVNEPADEYACIDQINIGNGFIPYTDFLDNRESLISELLMEDKQMNISNTKLSTASRQKLPDSAFCYVAGSGEGKVRKFPAHDAAHVKNGLTQVSQTELPESAKSKILACLKRKAKRFEIKVGTDFVSQESLDYINSIDSSLGLNDAWTDEEMKAIDALFSENPNFDDLPEEKANDNVQEQSPVENQDADKMKKDELIDAYKKLQEESKRAIEARDSKISKLEDKVTELETILIEREDEVNRYLDQVAGLEQKVRESIINNIIDLKKTDNKEEQDDLRKKLDSRTLESLTDSLSDLRTTDIKSEDSIESEDRVQDPTQQTQENNDTTEQEEKNTDPWSIFSKDNRTVEVE
jgi:hypothetical protein